MSVHAFSLFQQRHQARGSFYGVMVVASVSECFLKCGNMFGYRGSSMNFRCLRELQCCANNNKSVQAKTGSSLNNNPASRNSTFW